NMTPNGTCIDRTGPFNTAGTIGIASGANNFVSLTPNGNNPITASTAVSNNSINLNNASNAIPANMVIVLNQPQPDKQLSVSPLKLNFGVQTVGSITTLSVNICNPGLEAATTITGYTFVGAPDFTIA